MTKRRDIDELLEEVVTLPSLPSTIVRITELANDPDASLSVLGRAISADPAIALKTLRLVNSAYYGLRNKVSSVEQAVVLLGLKVIKNLVFTATFLDTLQSGAAVFLHHCVSCGVAMRALSESAKVPGLSKESSEEAFTIGLLHDVGKIVFEQFMPEEFRAVAQLACSKRVPWYQCEQEIIGVDHAELGARLAVKWKLPEDIADAVAGHHELSKSRATEVKAIAAALGVADYICTASGSGSYPGAVVALGADSWCATRLVGSDVPAVLARFFELQPTIEELVQLAA